MMILVDTINVWTRGKLGAILQRGRQGRQYVVSSLIGSLRGCVGAFTNVSLYVHGMISFGALVGAMAAASGDEAFVMLALFPKTALLIFALMFVLGVLTGWEVDRAIKVRNIKTCQDCQFSQFHPAQENLFHYIREHVWGHTIKHHLWRTALRTFGAMLAVELGLTYWSLGELSSQHTLLLLFTAAALGLVPESGPHLIFVTMFANGAIPISILITSGIVQDGHGMLPMLSYSLKDSILLKAFNLTFGLLVGLILFAFWV